MEINTDEYKALTPQSQNASLDGGPIENVKDFLENMIPGSASDFYGRIGLTSKSAFWCVWV